MKYWLRQFRVSALVVVAGILFVRFGMKIESNDTRSQTLAAWVQAVGSIGAILGAIWVASEQHRRDVVRRKEEQDRASYLVRAELAWLGHEIVTFLNQFIDIDAGTTRAFAIHDDDIKDLLARLSWCRQRAEHKGQLAMVGTLRESLTKALRILRLREHHPELPFDQDAVDSLRDCRKLALEASNVANGSATSGQYAP